MMLMIRVMMVMMMMDPCGVNLVHYLSPSRSFSLIVFALTYASVFVPISPLPSHHINLVSSSRPTTETHKTKTINY